MKIHLPELTVEIRGDMVRLEQPRDLEYDVVELHRAQIAQLAILVGDAPLAEPSHPKKLAAK